MPNLYGLGGVPRLTPRNRSAARPAAGAPWWRIENSGDSERTIYLHGVVGGDWFGDGATPENVVRDIQDFTGSTLNVRINSPGGAVFDGIAIANALRAHPANVTIYVDGLAASIASVIAVSGDKTVMMPNTQMMIHNASGVCFGMASDMRKAADMLDSVTGNIADAYTDRAGGERADWLARMEAETWYTAAEAVAAGLADEVAPARNAPTTGDDRDPSELASERDPSELFEDAMRLVPVGLFGHHGRADAPAPQLHNRRNPPDAPPVPVVKVNAEAFRLALSGGKGAQ